MVQAKQIRVVLNLKTWEKIDTTGLGYPAVRLSEASEGGGAWRWLT